MCSAQFGSVQCRKYPSQAPDWLLYAPKGRAALSCCWPCDKRAERMNWELKRCIIPNVYVKWNSLNYAEQPCLLIYVLVPSCFASVRNRQGWKMIVKSVCCSPGNSLTRYACVRPWYSRVYVGRRRGCSQVRPAHSSAGTNLGLAVQCRQPGPKLGDIKT